MQKLKKTLLFSAAAVTIVAVIVIVFISPITKYLVEKYDEQYTGRQIKMDWAYVNPFTGYMHFSNLEIYESKNLSAFKEGDTVFFSANGLSINIAMLKLFSKTYEISELTLDRPRGVIIQKGKDLNFDDLIKKFSPDSTSDTTKAPVHFNILTIKINEGEFYYREQLIPINYFIKKVNIESTGIHWDADTITALFSFLPGTGSGSAKGRLTMNLKNLDYRLAAVVNKFDLQLIEQYLKELTNYGTFSANVDADIKATGNFNNAENINATGMLAINDFHFGKNRKDDYASFDKLILAIKELSPGNHKYFFDSVSLNQPYVKYELYDSLDNIQTMFGNGGSRIAATKVETDRFNLVIEIADYIKVLAKNFFKSDYKITRLGIYNGNVEYNDYSLSEKFAVALKPLTIIADSIDKNHERVNVSFNSHIKPYGDATISVSINPKDSSDFDLNYNFQKIPLATFNPYAINYTSFPLDRGTAEVKGKWNVRNGKIESENHLVLIDPRLTLRLKNKGNHWIPMRLVMAFAREKGNVIDYEIPISGNLKNPQFHVKDIIFDALENIFAKPASTPYRAEVKKLETEIEKTLTLKWEMRRSSLSHKQEKFIEKVTDFLAGNPDATITVYPQLYALKEKEYILLYEARKKYFLFSNNKNPESFSKEDSESVEKMSVKDKSFINYLNRQVNDSLLFTVQEKCNKVIDLAFVNSKFNQLNNKRADTFLSYFKKREVEKQIKIAAGENIIPYNGFSFYKIDFKGEYPESLIKAYRKMNELNDELPRKKFKQERKENKESL